MVKPMLTYYIRIEEKVVELLSDRTAGNGNIKIKYIHEFLTLRHKGTLLFQIKMNENDATALKLAIPTVGWVNFDSTNQAGRATIN